MSNNHAHRFYTNKIKLKKINLEKCSKYFQEIATHVFDAVYQPDRKWEEIIFLPYVYKDFIAEIYRNSDEDFLSWRLKVREAMERYFIRKSMEPSQARYERTLDQLMNLFFLDSQESFHLAKIHAHNQAHNMELHNQLTEMAYRG